MKDMKSDLIQSLIEKTLSGKNDSDGHLMSLFSIALSLNAKSIIELGVRSCDTTLPLLLATKFTGGHLHSVDINLPPKERLAQIPKELKSGWFLHESCAIDFLKSWKKNTNYPVDLIYLDDFHSYDHVKQELEIIDEIVSPSSLVLIHDLMYANWEPHYHTDLAVSSGQWANGGPYRAVAELDKNFWEFSTIPTCNGLTILRKKYSSRFFK